MSDDQFGIIGIIVLGIIVLCLYFSPEIHDLIDRKKDERKKAREKLSPAELEEKERNGFKAMFTHRVVGPLAIGHVIGLTGYVFEYDPLIWIGVGLIGYGFFLMLRGD